jgi:hypothetical protein
VKIVNKSFFFLTFSIFNKFLLLKDFEADFEIVLNDLRQSSVKTLWLSRNFVNIKLKYLKKRSLDNSSRYK